MRPRRGDGGAHELTFAVVCCCCCCCCRQMFIEKHDFSQFDAALKRAQEEVRSRKVLLDLSK